MSARPMLLAIVKSLLITSSLCVLIHASVLILAPLYGETAAGLYATKVAVISIMFSTFLHGQSSAQWLSRLLCTAPPILYYLGAVTARWGDPVLGAALTSTVAMGPIYASANAFLQSTWAAHFGERPIGQIGFENISISVLMCAGLRWSQCVVPVLPVLPPFIFLCFSWLVALPSLVNLSITRSQLLLVVLTTVALLTPPTHVMKLPYTHPSGLVRILSSTSSTTGQIVVGDSLEHSLRYLRADHSILGGVWIGQNVAKMDKGIKKYELKDKDGVDLGDSIYGAFVLQEAVRLYETEKMQEKVLIIGLGAGISAQAFMLHGLKTSVVEIDPAVYSAARDYFGLSKPHAVYLEDAGSWIAERARVVAEPKVSSEDDIGKFDIIVHDCFSGGGVPQHLFTVEFWKELKSSLDEEGIVAVNFAGKIDSNPAKSILVTLQSVFKSCRVFHDAQRDSPVEELKHEFMNLVFFCTPAPTPLKFRKASTKDYLNSYLREHILNNFHNREVDMEWFGLEGDRQPWLITRDNNTLGAWQKEGALEHWTLMRGLMSNMHWETY